MKVSLKDRILHSWNVFKNPYTVETSSISSWSIRRPDINTMTVLNERTIIASIYNKIAIDVSNVDFHHVDTVEGRFQDIRRGSLLEERLSSRANIDQTSRDFIQTAVLELFDSGSIALIPVKMELDPDDTSSFSIKSLRCGTIKEWFPQDIRVNVYNEDLGIRQDIIVPKKIAAIIYNPFRVVMNDINSTFTRLVKKLNLLDKVDANNNNGKLDILIQVPYTLRRTAGQSYAKERQSDLESQLNNSVYGVGFIDQTEKVIQLNRAAENTLITQIQYLTEMLYTQLGISPAVFSGVAEESEMLNYYARTVDIIAASFVESMRTTFLTKTARSQGQSIMFFRDPFKLTAPSALADISDKFTRNEILSSNEVRSVIGYKPSDDPRADELINKNINFDNNASAESIKKGNENDERKPNDE